MVEKSVFESSVDLLPRITELVARERGVQKEMILALADFHSQGLYRAQAHSSLFTFLVERFDYPKASAYRRAAAAKSVAKHPAVREAFEAGDLTMSAVAAVSKVLEEKVIGAPELVAMITGVKLADVEGVPGTSGRSRPSGGLSVRYRSGRLPPRSTP